MTTSRRKKNPGKEEFFLYVFFFHMFSGITNFFKDLFTDHDSSDF